MSQKARQRKQRRERKPDNLVFRAAATKPKSLNEDDRSVEAAIATENPVMEFDWERMEMVPRVLLARGAQFAKQIPLLDSHYPRNVANQAGSIRGLSKDDGEVRGTLVFSSAAEDTWTKVREGHVTDVSVGFRVDDTGTIYVPEGKTRKIRGREFAGPVNVETRWRALEGSVTPIGADEQAKLRGLDPATLQLPRRNTMDEQLRQQLVDAGLPEDASDEDAREFLAARLKKEEPKKTSTVTTTEPKIFDPEKLARTITDQVTQTVTASIDAREASRLQFRKDVEGVCELAEMPVSDDYYRLDSIEKVRERVLEQKRERQVEVGSGFRAVPGGTQRECHTDALRDALRLRAYQNARISKVKIEEVMPLDKRAEGWADFQYAGLLDFARECLRADGIDPTRLTKEQIAKTALGFRVQGVRAEPGYHTTASFPDLTLDALNKTLRMGYGEARTTWQTCFRQAESVADFKDIQRIQLGAVPNLPIWIDNDKMNQSSMDDAKVTYAVEARATQVSLSWRLVVNDDMDALGRIPGSMGSAAARTVNAAAWSVITANGDMPYDSEALFVAATGDRAKTNLTTGAGAPSTSTVGTLTKLMRLMTGMNTPEAAAGPDILNLEPAYIVGPAALETTILQLVMSGFDPGASNSIKYNTANTLTPVIEPLLDANSATAWYLMCDPSQCDTVEVTFLQGQETPATNSYQDNETWSQNYQIVQTFEAQAIDHRGMQKHAGA